MELMSRINVYFGWAQVVPDDGGRRQILFRVLKGSSALYPQETSEYSKANEYSEKAKQKQQQQQKRQNNYYNHPTEPDGICHMGVSFKYGSALKVCLS